MVSELQSLNHEIASYGLSSSLVLNLRCTRDFGNLEFGCELKKVFVLVYFTNMGMLKKVWMDDFKINKKLVFWMQMKK